MIAIVAYAIEYLRAGTTNKVIYYALKTFLRLKVSIVTHIQ